MNWNKMSQQGFLVAESAAPKAFAETDPIDSDVIVGDIGGSKIVTGFNITTAGDDHTTPFQYFMSHDGVHWTAATQINANEALDATGVVVHETDLTGKHAPYWKLRLAPGGDAGTTGRVKFIYSKPPKY